MMIFETLTERVVTMKSCKGFLRGGVINHDALVDISGSESFGLHQFEDIVTEIAATMVFCSKKQ
jgi:hypothetical protein